MADKYSTITKELLHEIFEYKDGELFYKIKPNKKASLVKVGMKAGSLYNDGYLRITYKKQRYAIHNLIFFMFYGYKPEIVDHIDGDILNNKIENLRAATRSQNCQNSKLAKNNTSGVKGVTWHKYHKKWLAVCSINKKYTYIGYFKNLEDAKNAVIKFREETHGNFANNG